MSDQIDCASKLEQCYYDDALERQRANSKCTVPAYELDGIRYCLGCHCSIGTARLIANPQAVRCVSCQQLHE